MPQTLSLAPPVLPLPAPSAVAGTAASTASLASSALSAEDLHRILLRAHRLGNVAR